MALGKSPWPTRTSQPVPDCWVVWLLSAPMPAPSRAAISSLACCSSRLLYSAVRPQAANNRQTSTADSAARHHVGVAARRSVNPRMRTSPLIPSMPRPPSGLLTEQLLDAIGRAVGHVRGQFALEHELMALHGHLDDLTRRCIGRVRGQLVGQRADPVGAAI